ncbi:MAG: autotransporter-associated beta strand repeat-containing protein [Bacteroidales bacterium]|nr:autotransporter-associated beta strand repeat-containing protein [Bacteroidales bacterium]
MKKLLLFVFLIPIIIQAQTTVTYPQRTANYYSSTTDASAFYNQGDYQIGMWANFAWGSGTDDHVMAFRKFRTDASGGSTSDRSLQLGDEFVVRLSSTRVYGQLGIALLASPSSTSSWSDRENNYAVSVYLDGPQYTGSGYDNWEVKYNGGTTSNASFGASESTYTDFTIAFTLVAIDRMNITISNGSTSSEFYDVQLNSSSPISDYCIFLENDWDGSANRNIYWGLGAEATQHSLSNLGMCTFGQSNTSYTISSIITDGLDAASNSTISKNDLIKQGSGTLTLSGSNSYTDITDIWEGTLLLGASGVIPDVSDVNLGGGTFSTGSGAGFAETAGKLIVQSASTINLGTGSHNLNFANTGSEDWGDNLSVTGWTGVEGVSGGGTAGKIFIGTDNTGLSATNLSYIQFSGYPVGATQKTDGEVVPAYAQAPSTNSSGGPIFANVLATKMDLSWTSGNGSNRIVVVREGSAVSWTPSNGTSYTANADFSLATDQGSGNKVCYNGSGNNFSISGLSAGNTYHFAVFEFNGSSATISYLTSGQLTGSQATSSSYQTVASGGTNWSSTASWLDGVVPPSEALIIIDDDVVLNQDATVSKITINNGSTLTASDASARILTITKSTAGDEATFVNNGTWAIGSGGSTVVFTGSPSSGDARHQISGTNSFQNITVNKTGGSSNVGASFAAGSTVSGTLRIGAGGFISTAPPANFYGTNAILDFNQGVGANYNVNSGDYSWSITEIPNNITITTGTVTLNEARSFSGLLLIQSGAAIVTNGNLTLESDASGTASLLNYGTVTGNITAERYIAGYTTDTDGWHLFSSPVATFNISGSDFEPGGTEDLFSWDEVSGYWLNYAQGSPTQIAAGQGYLGAYQSTGTKNFSGTINNADITLNDLSSTGSSTNQGWHLLGNPFPCALKWDATSWSRTNVDATAKKWVESSAAYVDLLQNDIIPAMQGFMVHVSSATNSITIPLADRVHDATNWYKDEVVNVLKLTARDFEGNTAQESNLRFNPNATSGYDTEFDSYYLSGYAPQFYTVVDGKPTSTNTLPELTEELQVPFYFVKNGSSSFSIKLEGLQSLEIDSPVYLTDLKTNQTINFREVDDYTFESEAGDDPARFILHFKSTGINHPTHSSQPLITIQDYQLNISNLDEGKVDVRIVDIMGRVLDFRNFNTNSEVTMPLELKTGIYVLEISNNQSIFARKVFIR